MNVFDFAMKMELQGKTFYEGLAASTGHPGLKTIFNGLAVDEQKHYDIFRDLKEGKNWSMSDSAILDEAKTVFQSFIANQELAERELREDLDGYQMGLKIEEESVKLYEDMAKQAQDPELVQLYLRIANEEKQHYNILENVREFVMRPKYHLVWREFSNLDEL